MTKNAPPQGADHGYALSPLQLKSDESADGDALGVGSLGRIPQIVFPPDGRERVRNTVTYPWNTIGQLWMLFPNGHHYTGTGTLVDKHHVLTAAHNLFGNDIGGKAKSVYFRPARNGNEMPFGTIAATDFFITDEYKRQSPADPDRTPDGNVENYAQYIEDYAIVRLEKPLSLPIMGMVAATADQLNGAEARITGYPGDKPAGTMWTDKGPLPKPDDHFLFYKKISTFKGQSGAGVFVDLKLPVGKSLVGIHIAGDRKLGANFAVRLTNVEIKQILAWMRA